MIHSLPFLKSGEGGFLFNLCGINPDMKDAIEFSPSRRFGYIFHVGVILLLIGSGAYGLLRASEASIGLTFLIALLPAFIAVFLVPILGYRLYALQNSSYLLGRDGIRLTWGIRSEDVPMSAVLWVRPASELQNRLPLPWFFWPGSVLGVRRFGGAGQVEFMAVTTRNLLLIATPQKIFAITPDSRENFLNTFHRLAELGSLSPITPRSIQPRLLFGRIWGSMAARLLILAGFTLSLILLVWVSLVIPELNQTFLGFQSTGSPREPVPPVRLLLLPIINSLIYMINLLLGVFFFRQDENHPLAYLFWASSIATTLIFLLDIFFILTRG
jgi:hypothetical protein